MFESILFVRYFKNKGIVYKNCSHSSLVQTPSEADRLSN
jgi:hypothetical protein